MSAFAPTLDRSVRVDPNALLADVVEHARAISISGEVEHETRSFAEKVLALHGHVMNGGVLPAAWTA
jgi:predicted aconitase with swiveling domain